MKKDSGKCKWCTRAIPTSRKRSAEYCSDQCYYEAKKERSCISYQNNTAAAKAIKRNERILDKFYLLVELDREFYYDDLEKNNFDFGLSEGQTAGSGNVVGTIVGRYAYYIDPKTQKILLWKLKDVK